MKFKVFSNTFDTFEQVKKWAWNTYKIDAPEDEPTTDEQKHELCKELENLIKEGEDE